jgi:hypothetical protein
MIEYDSTDTDQGNFMSRLTGLWGLGAGAAVQHRRAWQALRYQALLVGDAPQQGCELPALRPGQRGAELSLMIAHHLPDLLQHVPAQVGQVQRVRAPVGRIAPALDQAALLEFVDHEHHAGGVQPQQLPYRLLRLALVGREPVEHPGVALFEAKRCEQLTEAAGEVEAELDKDQPEVVVGRRLSSHTWILSKS